MAGRFRKKKKLLSEVNHVAGKSHLLNKRGVRLLHVYSEGDEGLDYLHVIFGDKLKEWLASEQQQMEVIEGANHTLTLLWSQETLLKLIQNWARAMVHD